MKRNHKNIAMFSNSKVFIKSTICILLISTTLAAEEEKKSRRQGSASSIVKRNLPTSGRATPIPSEPLQGLTRPVKMANLMPSVPGSIAKVLVQEGDSVKMGALLIQLNDQVARSAVATAEIEAKQDAAIRSAQLDWELESRRFARLQSITNSNAVSQLELNEKIAVRDQKRALLDEARERRALAEARLQQAKAEWLRHQIVAPFPGQVIEIHQKVGAVPQTGEPVITVADLRELEVEIHLPMSWFGKIRAGQSVQLEAYAPVDRSLQGTVQSVSPIINSTSQTFRCLISIPNSDLEFPAGFAVSFTSVQP